MRARRMVRLTGHMARFNGCAKWVGPCKPLADVARPARRRDSCAGVAARLLRLLQHSSPSLLARAIHTPPLLCQLYTACIVAALLAAAVCIQARAAARRRRKEVEEAAAQETRARVLAAAAARRSALAAEAAAAAAGPPPTGRTSRTYAQRWGVAWGYCVPAGRPRLVAQGVVWGLCTDRTHAQWRGVRSLFQLYARSLAKCGVRHRVQAMRMLCGGV